MEAGISANCIATWWAKQRKRDMYVGKQHKKCIGWQSTTREVLQKLVRTGC